MKTLPLYAVENTDHLVLPSDFDGADLNTPALELVNDFKHSAPDIIDADTPASDTLAMMQHEHSRLKLVVDSKGKLVGLIGLEQLSGQTIMRRVANGDLRHEILVSDLMRPREQLKALAYQQLQSCTIADVVATLQHSGESYCLIVERHSHQIRGVISAEDIAERLHIPLNINKAPTFLNIFDSLSS
ncbi:CBS domain-containing protein [uncultured Oceanisphaera sp.]|uniref:CBS domain-containing protein n=1 Tax=uncultured Oceanisphaera sp. TaxID=353858 RepID=UPI00260EDD07|nr:CBS domain-containing protein [uncultured Oceanisphaera sp.]